ncbi:hypothetical protein G1H11_07155 [Phytoactinopolyspora alkaliphila]|uniref:Capsular polysaccharide biosynthesis protein n=1 Tax=Phytoactinopolyspora alkaliphila TaxID=1783498 RepID=A0A6N9YJN1_9ACTN|nr:hypothetical protein [Phytoactinopolyspora alkaliphila]NED95089.1 hypothetical protein [Phytoactinopolyspora alkaliphila]
MDVWRITVAALRRWYILLPLLALTGYAVTQAGTQQDPEYEARASAMLTPARVLSEIPNPYSSLNGAQEALAIVLNSTETRRSIASEGLAGHYEVKAAPRSSIFQVVTRAESRQAAEEISSAVLNKASEELESRQSDAGLPERAHYSIEVLESPSVTGVVENSQLRVQAVVGVLGASLALLIAVMFDDMVGIFRRARAKRRRRNDMTPSTPIDENSGQLTLDDIPIVSTEPISLVDGIPANSHGSPVDQWAPSTGRRRIPTGQRPHASLLGEAKRDHVPTNEHDRRPDGPPEDSDKAPVSPNSDDSENMQRTSQHR